MRDIRILCLCGSLRRASYNAALIRALPRLAPDTVRFIEFNEVGVLPLFNPDREDEKIPSVEKLKREIASANGLIIASPEYAHGISGVIKNALDWLVSSEDFPGMPIALINTSPRATHAQEALREVLKTMSGVVVESACVSIPLLGSNFDENGIVNHPSISTEVRNALTCFVDWIYGNVANH
jgi:NAD(P)H-dependent FMN reductase